LVKGKEVIFDQRSSTFEEEKYTHEGKTKAIVLDRIDA
jgi:hypothetical protein